MPKQHPFELMDLGPFALGLPKALRGPLRGVGYLRR